MKVQRFSRRVRIDAPADEVFRWHARPGAFERLTPPWEPVEIVERSGGIENGARLVMRMKSGPVAMRWVALHRDYEEGRQFCDVQTVGPFALWEHTHRIEPDGARACTLEDRIEYALPLGALGNALAGRLTRNKLDRMFRYRHTVTAQDIEAHRRYSWSRSNSFRAAMPIGAAVGRARGRDVEQGDSPMKIAISGASGLVGGALVPFLTTGGHEVLRLVRSGARGENREIGWNPAKGQIDTAALEGLDAVVHLAGENISSGRWTETRKRRILSSRVDGTRLLAETLAKLERPPRVLVAASAIGYYGNRGDQKLDEQSAPGEGFLADVCKEWEEAASPATEKGIRVVRLRFGVVLSSAGGALAKMLPPFRFGLGGVIGSGKQYMSWLTLDDAVGIVHHALASDSLSGPVNAVAPNPVTNREFTRTLGRVLSRPTLLPVPAFAARLSFGEMADELLLSSTRVEPAKLGESGYTFRFAELEAALRHLLGR